MTLALRWRASTRPVELRWRGPDLQPAALPPSTAPGALTAIVGPSGADGGANQVQAVAATALVAGMPAAIDRSTGKMIAADAGWKPSAFVIGLVHFATAAGFVADALSSQLTLADWTAITGSASLLTGQAYFLAVGGGLTTVPPASPACLVLVGKAVSPTTFLIDPQPPIQL